MTVFAKGNLDVRDSLHSLRVGDKVLWNGINEVVRARFPGTLIRLRHETCTRSDAVLEASGIVPPSLSERALELGAYPEAAQFSRAMFEPGHDAIILSLQPEVSNGLARHRRDGYLLYTAGIEQWPPADKAWLRDAFIPLPPLEVEASMANLEAIVARLRRHSDAPILVYNLSTLVPGDSVHCHLGLGDIVSTRIKRFNLSLIDLSQQSAISIIDVDAVVARAGADRVKLDALHLSAEGCRLVAEEVVRVLEDVGCLGEAG